MAPESESERISRIREAQIGARGRNVPKPRSSVANNSPSKSKKQASPARPKLKLVPPVVFRANTRANAVHDIVVGTAIAIIPAILVFIILPGTFKLLGILLLVSGGTVGYLLGETSE